MKCPNPACGAEVADSTAFCPACGTRVTILGSTGNGETVRDAEDALGLRDFQMASLGEHATMAPVEPDGGILEGRGDTTSGTCGLLDFGKGRRVFVIAQRTLGFGKDKREKSEGRQVDITLRLLPCRSKSEDPENWRRNMMISHTHGFFGCEGGRMYVQNASLNGVYLFCGNVDSEAVSASIGEYGSTLEEGGAIPDDSEESLRLLAKGDWSPLADVSVLSLGKTGLLHLKTRIFREGGHVDAMRIERMSNWTQHTYVQLIRRATLGNARSSCIPLGDAPPTCGDMAELTWDDGRFCIAGTGREPSAIVEGVEVPKGVQVPLTEDAYVEVGAASFRFRTATDDDFVTT